jgi:hypothetical protein
MEQRLSGVDRSSIIKLTAIYLVVYAVLNACGGILLGIVGGLAAGAGVFVGTSEELASSGEAAAASSALLGLGGLIVVLGLLSLISVPVFAGAAFGLWRRTSWARTATIIALGLSILLSALTLNNSASNFVWIVVSAFGIYLFLTDAGIKQELGG